MCTILPHSFPHPRLPSTARSWGVWVLAFLPSLATAATIVSASFLPGLPLGTHHDEHSVLADSHRFIHSPLLGVTEGRVRGPVGLCHDQTCCLAYIHQWPPLCACGLLVPLLPPGSPLSWGRGAKISPPASPAPTCLPQPPSLPPLHTRPLPVFLLASPQSASTAAKGPHPGLAGFCGDREELLLGLVDAGVARRCRRHVQRGSSSPTPVRSSQDFPLLHNFLRSPHPLPDTQSHHQR